MSSKRIILRLDEIAQINPKRRVKKGTSVPFIDMAALPQNFRDIKDNDVEIRVAKGAGAHFQNGDTLLARITPCLENGKTAQVNCLDKNCIGEGSTEFIVLCGIDHIDNDYIYYLCRDPIFRKYAIRYMEGTSGRQRVSWRSIAAYEFPFPQPNERRVAAQVLSLIDDHIKLLSDMNSTIEAIAQALFKCWFVDFDPVRAKQEGKKLEGMDEATAALFPHSFEKSELGEIPKGWEIKNLGQVAYNVKSRIKNAEDWKDLDLLDLSRMPRKILFPFEYAKGKELSTSVFEFKKDDCLFGAVRPYFHKVCHATRNGVTNSSVLVIRSLVPENQFFINLVASSKKCVTHAISYSQGTKMPTINWENLSRFSIVCPPNNLQSIFCEYVSPFFKKALNNSLIINLLTELRDVLLPRLVTGQLKLPNSCEINNKTMENH